MQTQDSEISPLKRALSALEAMKARLDAAQRTEPLAIIGVGCRLPGGVSGLEDYRRLLLDGRDAIVPVPPERWPIDQWYGEDRHAPGRMNMRRAGFLSGGIRGFDADHFGIAPREAAMMDPQQRLVLEVAHEALEQAGIAPDSLSGTPCGVFLGLYNNNYVLTGRGSPAPDLIDGWSASGGHTSVASGRLSYLLGLTGPSISIDTACSSSLVAVHLAANALANRECDMALAGGVHLLLSPEALVASTKLGATAPDGRCKPFDAAADGFGHGEGCGIIVLKRLSDALAAGDPVLALIQGSAVNQDGRSNSLTAPNGPAQAAVIRAALNRAGIAPHQVGYVEAHGTGTPLGDPIEVEALAQALGDGRDTPLILGAVKANIGHLEAAAGIAGLIKAVIAVRDGMVPGQLHFTQINPAIDTGGVPVTIPTSVTQWPGLEGRRIAGVSSFGFGGTNAHVVIEAAQDRPPAVSTPGRTRILPLSARTEAALSALAADWAVALETGRVSPADAAATAARGRAHLPVRVAVTGHDAASLAKALRQSTPVLSGRKPRIGFLFTGQGAQYQGMAKGAYDRFPVFRAALDRAALALDPLLPRPALDLLFGDAPLDDTSLAQPLLLAVELALVDLWRSLGVVPSIVMGHSVGEYAASVTAGVMGEADALRLIAARGRLMGDLPTGGGMLAVFAAPDRLLPLRPGLSLAALNGPTNTVISGSVTLLSEFSALLVANGIESRPLSVSHAFHSTLLDPMLPGLRDAASSVPMRAPHIPIISNLTGRAHDRFDAAYWVDHARQPVRFADGLAAMDCDILLEIGPQPVLSALASAAGRTALPSLRRGRADDAVLAETVAALYSTGVAIDWPAWDTDGVRVAAPPYPFQRRDFWLDLPAQHGTPAADAPQPVALVAAGSALVYDFYDELTVVSRTYETLAKDGASNGVPDDVEQEAHLTFGFLAHPAPGFSWVRALFEKEADPAAHALFRTTQRALKDSLFDGIDFTHITSVFDYGCGHAADLCSLALAHPHLNARGFTISAEQVRVGMGRIARLGLSDRVRVDRNDSSAVAFPGRFDLIFGFEVTGLIANKEGLFDNIAAHLNPGGLLVIADFMSTSDPIANHETNSFTPDLGQWVELLSTRRLRLVRSVDASLEVANWLDDPDFDANVDQIVARFALSPLTHKHLLSNGNIGRALRLDVMRYLLLTAQYAPFETVEGLRAANRALLSGATPYADTPSARRAPAWVSSILTVEWRPTSTAPLPAPSALAATLAPDLARATASLAAFGETGAVMDALSRDFAIQALARLGATDLADAAYIQVAPAHRRLRDRLMVMLAAAGTTRLSDPGDVSARLRMAEAVHPHAAAELALLSRCGPALADVLSGRTDPLTLLFPGGDSHLANQLYEVSPYSRAVQGLAAASIAALPRDRALNVVEIGGGTAATTAHLLPHLPAGSRYLFTDLGPSLVARARDRFAGPASHGVQMDFTVLDIARPPDAQGIATGAFDLVVAANVIHAAPDLRRALAHARSLLRPGGLILLVENTGNLAWGDLTFGLTEGMWNFTDTDLRDYALLRQAQWRDLLRDEGWADIALLSPGPADAGGVSQQCVILAQAPVRRSWHLIGQDAALAAALTQAGDEIASPEAASDLLILAPTNPHPLEPEADLRPALYAAQDALRRGQRVTLVTAAGNTSDALPGGSLTGFARTLMGEVPDLHCRVIDRGQGIPTASLVQALRHAGGTEISLTPAGACTPRLVPQAGLSEHGDYTRRLAFDPEASYLITGGLGGIGLLLADWMADRGARHLLLAGRSAPGPAAADAITALRARGVEVLVQAADIGNAADVAALIAGAQAMGPLKGVMHAAGHVEDAAVGQVDWDRTRRVLNAKRAGGWHLHQATQSLALDHFVLFGSAAGLIGPSGQAAHAAANAFLDGLAAYRRAAGLAGLCIDWGAWGLVGAAVKDGVETHVNRTGLIHMNPVDALAALEWAMQWEQAPAHLAVAAVDWSAYAARFARGLVPSLLSDLVRPAAPVAAAVAPVVPTAAKGWRDQLAALPDSLRRDALSDRIRIEAARIMRMTDAGAIDTGRPLRDFGLDSLMSIELRNALVARLDVKLPATLLFDRPSVDALTGFVADGPLSDLFAAPDDLAGLDAAALSALLDAELEGT